MPKTNQDKSQKKQYNLYEWLKADIALFSGVRNGTKFSFIITDNSNKDEIRHHYEMCSEQMPSNHTKLMSVQVSPLLYKQ